MRIQLFGLLATLLLLASPTRLVAQGTWGAWQTISGSSETKGCGVDVRYRDTGERPNAEGRHHLWYGARNRCSQAVTVRFTFSNNMGTKPYEDLQVPAGRDGASWTYAANFAGAALLRSDEPSAPSVNQDMVSVIAWHVLNDWASRVERATIRYNEMLRRFTPGPGSQVLTWGKLLDRARRDVSKLRGLLEQTTGAGTTYLTGQIEETTRALRDSESPFQSAWTSAEREVTTADRERARQDEEQRRGREQQIARDRAARQTTAAQSRDDAIADGAAQIAQVLIDADARATAREAEAERRRDEVAGRRAAAAERTASRRSAAAGTEARLLATTAVLEAGGERFGEASLVGSQDCLDDRGEGSRNAQIAVSPDGRLVYFANEQEVCAAEVTTNGSASLRWRASKDLKLDGLGGRFGAIATRPDGSVVTYCWRCDRDRGRLLVLDPRQEKPLASYKLPFGRRGHAHMDVTRDGRLLLLNTRLSAGDSAALIDPTTGNVVRLLYAPQSVVRGLSPDGTLMAAATDSALFVEDARTGARRYAFATSTGWPQHVALSSDNRYVAVSGGGAVHLMDLVAGRLIWTVQEPGNLEGAAFQPDGQIIAIYGSAIRLARVADGAVLATLYRDTSEDGLSDPPLGLWRCEQASFARNGSTLACVDDGRAKVWRLTLGGTASVASTPGSSASPARSPEGSESGDRLDQMLVQAQALVEKQRVLEALPLLEELGVRGNAMQRENAAALFYTGGAPLLQEKSRDLARAAALFRRASEIANPAGKVAPAANYLLGLATLFQVPELDQPAEKQKSCALTQQMAALLNEAEKALHQGRSVSPEKVDRNLGIIREYRPRVSAMIRSYC